MIKTGVFAAVLALGLARGVASQSATTYHQISQTQTCGGEGYIEATAAQCEAFLQQPNSPATTYNLSPDKVNAGESGCILWDPSHLWWEYGPDDGSEAPCPSSLGCVCVAADTETDAPVPPPPPPSESQAADTADGEAAGRNFSFVLKVDAASFRAYSLSLYNKLIQEVVDSEQTDIRGGLHTAMATFPSTLAAYYLGIYDTCLAPDPEITSDAADDCANRYVHVGLCGPNTSTIACEPQTDFGSTTHYNATYTDGSMYGIALNESAWEINYQYQDDASPAMTLVPPTPFGSLATSFTPITQPCVQYLRCTQAVSVELYEPVSPVTLGFDVNAEEAAAFYGDAVEKVDEETHSFSPFTTTVYSTNVVSFLMVAYISHCSRVGSV